MKFREHLHIGRRVAKRAGRLARRIVTAPGAALASLRANAPERLLIAPQDLRTTDASIASEIYSGYFALAGKVVNLRGTSPFEAVAPSPGWARALASFGWLRHLRAADTALARANAHALVDDFLSRSDKPDHSAAWEARVAVRRMQSFLSQSPIILENADRAFYRRFMRALMRLQYFLERQIAIGAVRGEERLFAATSLAELGLCAKVSSNFQRRSTRLLAEELSRQIRPDGGHASRSADTLIRLLLDLLPLRQAYAARALPAPPELLNAIDRMLPMLRLLRHGDGSLALFNGMGVTPVDVLTTVLAYEDPRAKPMVNAPYTGYQRVEAGDSVLIVDTGRPPPPEFSTRAHAGTLSFELSIGTQRLIVNCGAPDSELSPARGAARATAAHSTLVVDDTSSSHFASGKGLEKWLGEEIISGPRQVTVERLNQPGGTRLVMAHDGYRARFDLIHERRLTLSADGLRLDGEDRLKSVAAKPRTYPFAIRFHVHPSVQLQSVLDGDAALLDLPNGTRWILSTQDAPIEIEESIFFAAPDGPRATQQLVIYRSAAEPPHVAWTLRALTGQEGREDRAEAED
ncbi:MAG: heparinase II/III family protein [Methylovirgula sp.]